MRKSWKRESARVGQRLGSLMSLRPLPLIWLVCCGAEAPPPATAESPWVVGAGARELGVWTYVRRPAEGETRVDALDATGVTIATLSAHREERTRVLIATTDHNDFELRRSPEAVALRVHSQGEQPRRWVGQVGASVRDMLALEQTSLLAVADEARLLAALTDDIVFADAAQPLGDSFPHESKIPGGRGYGAVNSARTRVRACDEEADGWGVRTHYSWFAFGSDLVGDHDGEDGGCGEEGAVGTPVTGFQACAGPNGGDDTCGPLVIF